MSFTLSQSALPVFETGLNALSAVLGKAASFAEAKKIEEAILLNTRLAPDMFNLCRQVQIATDMAKNGSARAAGHEAPRRDDTETTFAQLQERIADTISYLKTLEAAAINASPDARMTFPLGRANKGEMAKDAYVTHFVLPNFYFHVTTAYAILRHCGVEIGKMDFLGNIPMQRTPV